MLRKCYQLKAGTIQDLKLKKERLKDPNPDQVQVAIKAIGLNFADIFAIWGLYSATPEGVFIPGLEYAGIITKVGGEVKEYKVGDSVMGVTRFGAYTNCLNIEKKYLLALPKKWTFEEGAAYLVQILTAYYGLKELGNIQRDSTVLIHSAAGGVGILANRVAKKFNAFTIGTIGRANKVDILRQEGYNHYIIRGSGNFKKQLEQRLEGRPLDIVMECIGGQYFSGSYELLASQGRIIVYGSARYASPGDRPNYPKMIYHYLTRPKIDPQSMIEANKSIMGFNLIHLYDRVEVMHRLLKEIALLDIGKPHIGHVFEFNELIQAIKLFQTGNTVGKVVVRV